MPTAKRRISEKSGQPGGRQGFARITDRLSSFAAKPYSFPLFFLFAFFCMYLSARIGGFDVLDIDGDRNESVTFLYLLDYRVGFTTRLLVGAVLGLLTDQITPTLIFRIAGVSVLLSFVLHALLGGLVLRKSAAKREYLITLFSLVFLLHSLTSLQNIRIKGCLDTYIYIIFLLWLFFYDRYASILTAPVLCVIGMLIHYSYLFTFMPPVLALVFYRMITSEKRAKRVCSGVCFGLGAAAVIGLFLYFVFFANDHLKMTREELYPYLESKYVLTTMEEIHMRRIWSGQLFFHDYIDIYLYNIDMATGALGDSSAALGFIRNGVVSYMSVPVYLKYAALFFPFYVCFAVLWIACIRRARGIGKLPFVVFLFMPVMLLPACYISTDVWRWVSAAIISQLCVLFALYHVSDASLLAVLRSEWLRQASVKGTLCVLFAGYIVLALWFGVNLPIIY